ncbi:MAG: cytochrome c [Deltaproteobacteria bacterium]|nr:cytochrome c [Deltaproteobacteria bacterium]
MVEDPSDQNEFRGYFETLSSQAIHLEHAAVQRNPKMVSAATQRMLNDGCVSCHESFRDDIRERVKQSR